MQKECTFRYLLETIIKIKEIKAVKQKKEGKSKKNE